MPEITTAPEAQNLAQQLLESKLFCALFPMVAYVVAVLIQTNLNEIVNMGYGISVLYLSFGVRLFVALILGIQGLLWMLVGQLFIFAWYPTPYYQNHPVQGFFLTTSYSVIAYVVIMGYKKLRAIDDIDKAIGVKDLFLITLMAVSMATICHAFVFGEHFSDPVYGFLTSFAGKLVGAMLGFFILMLGFAWLHGIKTKQTVQ